MKIPFSNRTVDVELPNTQAQAKVTVKNIMEDFHRQTGDNFPRLFEAFVLLSPRKVRITCRTVLNMEEVCHLGLTFRDVRLTFNPVRTAKWVLLQLIPVIVFMLVRFKRASRPTRQVI